MNNHQLELRNHRPSLFVASSVEGLPIVEAIQILLEHDCEVVPWNTVFELSDVTLPALDRGIAEFDFAIAVLTPDDILESRGNRHIVPRDNLLLELGLFIGRLGSERTFAVVDKSVAVKLPSDLNGVTLATYYPPKFGSYASALGPACARIKRAITKRGVSQVSGD